MRAARVVAQCKVNLFLHVLAREASGYHQLETLFARLALGDDVTVRLGGATRSLDVAGPAMPAGGLGPVERNLAWRAAVAFAEATGLSDGFSIEIEKRIPVGGGLGGGSADAGAVLRAMNALVPSPLAEPALLAIAGKLGADVPFLTQARTPLALAWGRGDRMLTLPALTPRRCLLVCFPFGVPTLDAYGWLTASPAALCHPTVCDPQELSSWPTIERMAYNEFERVVAPRLTPIGTLLAALRAAEGDRRGEIVLMSGSGSTVFVLPPRGDGESGGGRNDVPARVAAVAAAVDARVVETAIAAAVEQVELLD